MKEGGSGDVVVLIHLSSTFGRREVDRPTGGYEYSRSGNPTRHALEKRLASMENARFGLAFASGLAAETVLCMTVIQSGDHVIAFDDLYGGTRRLFNRIFHPNFEVEISYVDATDPENVGKAIKENTRLIWLESPTNPLMKLCDLRAIADIAREWDILSVVDNTFMSPYLQRPLEFGIDAVVHSTTKYINGHSDSVGGSIMLSDEELYQRLKFNQNVMEIASFLEANPRVRRVYRVVHRASGPYDPCLHPEGGAGEGRHHRFPHQGLRGGRKYRRPERGPGQGTGKDMTS